MDGEWRRGECKMPGGKLVAVSVRSAAGMTARAVTGLTVRLAAGSATRPAAGVAASTAARTAASLTAGLTAGAAADGTGIDGPTAFEARIDGDFFVEGDAAESRALLAELERTIATASDTALEDRLAAVIAAHPRAVLVGADAYTIVTAAMRAMGQESAPAPVASRSARSTQGSENDEFPHLPGLTVVRDEPREPAMQLALDQACAEAAAAGRMGPTIRLWQWDRAAVVIGRFQSLANEVDMERAAAEDVTVVRRITGGGAMFAEPESVITYSLIAPLDAVDGLGIEESYRRCDRWVLDALRSLGIEARYQPINDIASPLGKIGGAAQRRFPGTDGGPGAVLHHTMLSYDIDAAKMTRILRISKEKMSDKAVKSAVKRVDPLRSQTGLTRAQVVDRMITTLTDPSGPYRARPAGTPGTDAEGAIPPQVLARAGELARVRFATPEWTAIIP